MYLQLSFPFSPFLEKSLGPDNLGSLLPFPPAALPHSLSCLSHTELPKEFLFPKVGAPTLPAPLVYHVIPKWQRKWLLAIPLPQL